MEKSVIALILVTITFFLTSCFQPQGSEEASRLTKTVEELEKRVSRLDDLVLGLDVQAKLDRISKDSEKTVDFDPSEPTSGFQKLQSSSGFFLVSLENVQPYLDGQRVTLHVGNPLSVTYRGFKVKAVWSARMPHFDGKDRAYGQKMTAWQNAKREKVINITEDLRPGAWNRVSFVIAPAKAEEFGHLEVGIETNQVSLAKGR